MFAAGLQASSMRAAGVWFAYLEHDPEKWAQVFGKDHAPTKIASGITGRMKVVPLGRAGSAPKLGGGRLQGIDRGARSEAGGRARGRRLRGGRGRQGAPRPQAQPYFAAAQDRERERERREIVEHAEQQQPGQPLFLVV